MPRELLLSCQLSVAEVMPCKRVGTVLSFRFAAIIRSASPWVALDYASCGVAAGRPPVPRGRADVRSDDAGPDISIRRVAHSLRTASRDSFPSPGIAKAAS